MLKRRRTRDRGKIRLSTYFQELKPGDKVAVIRDLAGDPRFPRRIQGKTGVIGGKQGKSYIVVIQDYNQQKKYIIQALHLKRLK
jgi:ribosomal protein L21E